MSASPSKPCIGTRWTISGVKKLGIIQKCIQYRQLEDNRADCWNRMFYMFFLCTVICVLYIFICLYMLTHVFYSVIHVFYVFACFIYGSCVCICLYSVFVGWIYIYIHCTLLCMFLHISVCRIQFYICFYSFVYFSLFFYMFICFCMFHAFFWQLEDNRADCWKPLKI